MPPTQNAFLICLALAGVAFLALFLVAVVRTNRKNAAEDLRRRADAERSIREREQSHKRALESQMESTRFKDRLAASRSASASVPPPVSLSKDAAPASSSGSKVQPVTPYSYRSSTSGSSSRTRKKGRRSGRRGGSYGSRNGGYAGADCSSGSSCSAGGSSCGGGGGGGCGGGGGGD